MVEMKAERGWLDLIEEHLREYSWPLFTNQFIYYDHKSTVNIGNEKYINIHFSLDIKNKISIRDGLRFYLHHNRGTVSLKVPFCWSYKLGRVITKSANKSLKEELKKFKTNQEEEYV